MELLLNISLVIDMYLFSVCQALFSDITLKNLASKPCGCEYIVLSILSTFLDDTSMTALLDEELVTIMIMALFLIDEWHARLSQLWNFCCMFLYSGIIAYNYYS